MPRPLKVAHCGLGPIGRSIALLKKAWGEGLAGRLGLGLVILLLFLPVILLMLATGLAFTAISEISRRTESPVRAR